MASKLDKKVVAAIDFGTTFSGFSYVFKNKPTDIIINESWGGSLSLLSPKIPTSILLSKDYKRIAFGVEAESTFERLLEQNEGKPKAVEEILFRRFKMALNNLTDLSDMTEVSDVFETKTIAASKLFTLSIEYLKEEILKALKKHGIEMEDIHFVLTVPAIWNDKAKHLMRFAANEAGIKNEQLTLALESEVASVWCKKLSIDARGHQVAQMDQGTKYMLVDLGGGTSDIAIHTVDVDGDVRADSVPAGGDYGATSVDKTFFQVMEQNIFGPAVFKKFRTEHKGEYFRLLNDFEIQKRSASTSNKAAVKLDLPSDLLNIAKKEYGSELASKVENCGFQGLKLVNNKLKMDYEFVEFLFQYSIMSLLGDMKSLLAKHKDTTTVMVVGGFADCSFIQDAISKEFGSFLPIFPSDCSVAVLRGAAAYGLRPAVVRSRKAHFTYGFKGENDAFEKLVTVGESLNQDFVVTEVLEPPSTDMDVVEYSLYSSTDKNPAKVTDKTCVKLHTFFVQLPAGKSKSANDKKFERSVLFGDTELMFRIKYLKTGKVQLEYISFK